MHVQSYYSLIFNVNKNKPTTKIANNSQLITLDFLLSGLLSPSTPQASVITPSTTACKISTFKILVNR